MGDQHLNNAFGRILVLDGPWFEIQTAEYNDNNGANEYSVTQSNEDWKDNVKVVQDAFETQVRELKDSGLEKRFATDALRGWSMPIVVKRPSVANGSPSLKICTFKDM